MSTTLRRTTIYLGEKDIPRLVGIAKNRGEFNFPGERGVSLSALVRSVAVGQCAIVGPYSAEEWDLIILALDWASKNVSEFAGACELAIMREAPVLLLEASRRLMQEAI